MQAGDDPRALRTEPFLGEPQGHSRRGIQPSAIAAGGEQRGRLALEPPARVVLVGGTNGKGSSVAMLSALLSGCGAVGTYTSPHAIRYNERIAVNCEPATDVDIVAAFEQVEAARGDVPLTYFEFGTLAALAVFDAAKVDVAILEVGLGGRLDAVNIVEPDASLITNVSLDHCDWLGNDIETIAAEKAGVVHMLGTEFRWSTGQAHATNYIPTNVSRQEVVKKLPNKGVAG